MDRTNLPLVLLIGALTASAATAQPPSDVVLWAWHGTQDLRGLHAEAGDHLAVAYLAETIRVSPTQVAVMPRRSPLRLDPGTPRLAVVHLEVEPDVALERLEGLDETLLAAIDTVYAQDARGLQIDFDARGSQRPFYARLLRRLRERMPEHWALEMTALGSWCLQDRWLPTVPVDRVVPMLFGPGHEREQTFAALRRGPLPEPRCRESHGVREGSSSPRPPRRLYVFPNDGPWTLERALHVWRTEARDGPEPPEGPQPR